MPKPTDAKKVLDMLYGAPKPAVSRLDMNFKDVTKRMPELQQAAKLYEQGKITREQYYAIVDQLKPVTPYEFIPKPATAEEALAALTSDKVKSFGRTDVLTPGETIMSRLDIPAYSQKGTWVTSQHRLKPPADEPKTIYTPTMMLEGETKMLPGTKAARKVAKGEENKSSFATIRGAYKPGSDEEAVERAMEALRSKDYTQIGYDPERRGFFYDRRTMEPIIGTEEGIIQIGPLVLGKKPIRGKPEDFEYKDGGAVHMQDGGSPLNRFMGKTPKRGVSSLPGYGQGNILQDIESVAPRTAGAIDAALTGLPIVGRTLASPAVTAGSFIKEAIKSGDPSDTSPLQRALEASQEFITGDMRPMQTELGPEYLESAAEGLERFIRESKLPPILPQMRTPAAMPGALGAIKDVAKTATKANIPEVSAPKAATIPVQGVTYETATEGPFYRVRPSVSQAPAGQRRGTLESDGTQAGQRPAGGTGSDVSQPITNEAVQQVMADPANFVRQSADTYVQEAFGRPYELPEISESSIFKQAPIGRAFMLATTEDPTYKQTIFNEYARQMPEVIKQSGAKNYDELVAASYRQMAKETNEQFKRLPISLSYHRAGEGNYRNSKQMLQDVYGNKHLYVFQGGDEHPYLKAVDPETGLNENEKFRAVHDFFGHAIHGNEFGPKGEETAWAAHSQMYSPLARLAMSTETRGQNSTVNYTPLNAALKRTINELNMQRYEANRRGKTELVKEIDSQLKEAWNGFQFAPQKPLLLPPEFLNPRYEGEMPDYLRGLIKPEEGTFVNMPMMHFSKQAGLTETDPAFYGTGIKGEEAARLAGTGSVRPRTYFYTDESVTPEPGLGPHRYRAMGENLYDLAADPLMLNMLARETTRIPMTASSNKGLAQPTEATNALERLIRDYGYAGYINPQSTKPSAVMFGKVPVTPYKQGGPVKRVHISDNPDTMLLELMSAPRMQEGGKPPPGVRRAMAQQRGTVAPIPGIKTPAEFIGGYVGADPRYSVMDPDADALERAYRAGEATSVIGDIIGSITPFATASTLARANALPGAAVVKAGAKKPPNVMAEFEKALAKSGPPTPAQIKKADAAEERVKKEKKFAKLRPSEQRQAIEAARAEALGTTVDRSSKVLKALLPGEEDIIKSLQDIEGYEVAKAVPAYAVKEAKVKRARLREEPPTTPGASASEKEWQDWGKQFGVDMTLSKPVSLGISDLVAKREVKIPGGLEGTFTIPDMFWMKANNINPAALPKKVHDKLMQKFIRTHTVAEPDEVDIFNRLNFALLSPNAPLTSNEFLAMRARIRDKDELERLAARLGEENLSKKMAEELGVQSGAKGGMGVLGTADLANQAELARMILQKPEMFMIQPGETMRDVTMRVMNQVPGLGPKTASLATPWLDLEKANVSAVDLHMIRDATPRLLVDPDVGPAFRARMGKLLGVEPTVEAITSQPPNKVQEKAVQIVGGSDVSKVYRTKEGALNAIPEAAMPEKLVYEPKTLSNFNPFYSKVVEYVDESRGANPVLELFPEQWRKWDVIRERIEPHEFAHPDYRKLPKQSFSEMKAASDEHTAAGYRGQKPVMDESDWRKLYYGALAPLSIGAGVLSEMDTGTD